MDTAKFEEFIKKIEIAKKNGRVDLSTEEDLSIAIMNLISLEEHFFFTGAKTKKDEYFDILREVREMRKELLGKMIVKTEGEVWCISKHLLAASMRLLEVGTKLFSDGKKSEGKEMFSRAHRLYSIFWGVRLKLINLPDVKNIAAEDKKSDKAWTLDDIVDKMVDCFLYRNRISDCRGGYFVFFIGRRNGEMG